MKSIYGAILMTLTIYVAVSFVAIYMFGSAIKSDILENVAMEGGTWEAYLLRSLFLIVIACHIPFVFFAGKESFLIIIEEASRKIVSRSLEARIQEESDREGAKGAQAISHNDVMTFKTMKPLYYYGGTLGLYGVGVVGSMFIPDIGMLFGFVGAIVSSTLTFILPGGFYLIAERKFGDPETSDERIWLRRSCWVMLVLGFANFIFLFIGNILSIVNG
jgi:hypothetical protein